MCIIVDNNKMDGFRKNSVEARPIREWLGHGGVVVYGVGGKFKETSRTARTFLRGLRTAGQARPYSWKKIEEEHKTFQADLKSNDDHILALARASGARLLYSSDKNLHRDFTAVVKGGKIYQSRKHRHLLKKGICRKPAGRG